MREPTCACCKEIREVVGQLPARVIEVLEKHWPDESPPAAPEAPQTPPQPVESKTLTPEQIDAAARLHDLEPALLKAVIDVESGGRGYLADGRLKILFEGHWLWKMLKEKGIKPEEIAKAHPDLCYEKWTKAHYKGGAREWDRIAKVLEFGSATGKPGVFQQYKKAAYESCSWGMFQIMGFHWKGLGYDGVYEFKADLEKSEANQLSIILDWMTNNGLIKALRLKNWEGFVRGYNGSGQIPEYTKKLKAAYLKHGGAV